MTTSDSSPSAARRGSSGSNSACLFEPRVGSTSGTSVLAVLGSSGGVSAARFDPLIVLALSSSAVLAVDPTGGVTCSPGRIGRGNVLGAGSLLPLAASAGAAAGGGNGA